MHEVAIATRSRIGQRERNEDYLQSGAFDAGWFAVLSDGAGGHNNGADAADLVVRLVAHALGSIPSDSRTPPDLAQLVLLANATLNRQQEGLHGQKRMHATVVVLWIDRVTREATWSHVGDSRLYLLRHGRIAEVTRDDTVVQSLVDAGLVSSDQARDHSQRNQLMAAMGSDEPIQPHVRAPGCVTQDGDAFLLCSDGWYDRLEPSDIESCFADAGSADDWLTAMEGLVVQRQRANQDNFSAVAVWIGEPALVTRIGF